MERVDNETVENQIAEEWSGGDLTWLRIVDTHSGEVLESFVGTNLPIPDVSDVLTTGWKDRENGEWEEETSDGVRVISRLFQYYDVVDYDERYEGTLTIISLEVTSV